MATWRVHRINYTQFYWIGIVSLQLVCKPRVFTE